MDNIKTLMDKKQYELVLKITENSQNKDELFFRISAFLALGKGEKALQVIEKNQKLLEKDLPLLMRVNIEILCLLERFDEAYEKMNYYSALPYFSMEAEELLKDLPKKIKEEERNSYRNNKIDENEMRKILLSSTDDSLVLSVLNELKENELTSFLSILQRLMISYPKKSIRTYVLLMLIKSKANLKMNFLDENNEIIEVNPSFLAQPFANEIISNSINILSKNIKDPVVLEHSIQLLSTYCLFIFPHKVDFNSDELAFGSLFAAKELLGQSSNLKEEIKETDVDFEIVNKVKEKILKINKEF